MTTASTDPRAVSILGCPNCGASNRITANPRGVPHCGTCGKPLPWLVNANESTFEAEVRAAPTVVVDLWAPWCGPCRFVGPILEELSREWAGRLKVVKVNVDENQGLAMRYDARSIPTMLVMRDGVVVDRIVGALPKPALVARLEPQLKPPRKASASASADGGGVAPASS
jgi:thioredoxin 2